MKVFFTTERTDEEAASDAVARAVAATALCTPTKSATEIRSATAIDQSNSSAAKVFIQTVASHSNSNSAAERKVLVV